MPKYAYDLLKNLPMQSQINPDIIIIVNAPILANINIFCILEVSFTP